MIRKEKYEDTGEMLLTALAGWQAGIWTAMPGVVQSYDPATQTCAVQLTIKLRVVDADGGVTWQDISKLGECPVHFPKGGGYTLTFPVRAGDECLVVFASRCVDLWWQDGGIQEADFLRMHDLSDGFVFVGYSSVPNVIESISTDSVELRNDAGDTKISMKNGEIKLVGAVEVIGSIKCNGHDIGDTHRHKNTSPGIGLSGVPQ